MMRPNDDPSILDDSMVSPKKDHKELVSSTMEDTTPISTASHPSDEASPMSTGRVLDFGAEDSDDDLL